MRFSIAPLACVLTLLLAGPALAGGDLFVHVSGSGVAQEFPGTGIDCAGSADGTEGGDCQETYTDVIDCTSGDCLFFTPRIRLYAAAEPGWTFLGWEGCDLVDEIDGSECTVLMTDTRSITARMRANALDGVALTAPADGAWVTGSVDAAAVVGTGGGIARVEFLADDVEQVEADSSPYGAGIDTSGLPDGDVVLKARAVDGAGNAATSAGRTIHVDNTAPAVDITGGPDGDTFGPGTTQRWTFAAADAGIGLASTRCAIDAATPVDCSGVFEASGLGEGTHTLTLTATDQLGHSTTATRSFRIAQPAGGGDPDAGGTGSVDATVGGSGDGATGGPPSSPADADAGAPRRTAAAKLLRRFATSRRGTRVALLKLTSITRGARVTVRCRGGGCGFKTRRANVRRRRSDLTRLFAKRVLRSGAVIEIRVARSGMVTRVFRLEVRRRRPPQLRVG